MKRLIVMKNKNNSVAMVELHSLKKKKNLMMSCFLPQNHMPYYNMNLALSPMAILCS